MSLLLSSVLGYDLGVRVIVDNDLFTGCMYWILFVIYLQLLLISNKGAVYNHVVQQKITLG